MLHGYQSPYDKVSAMERHGDIIRLKKDLYVVSEKISRKTISRELVANHLYSPSYVSLESALAYYGLIPERVYSVRSVCTKMHKNYDTPLGHFEFVKVPSAYFPIGIRQEIVDNQYAFLIASPEKALCDKIITTPNLRIQSVKAMREYLEEDLRFEISALQKFDIGVIRQCAEVGRKKTELRELEKLLFYISINRS
jgi:predicted transcriptional regulator of viral defense system